MFYILGNKKTYFKLLFLGFCLFMNRGFTQERLSLDTRISEYRQSKITQATEQIGEVLELSIETLQEIAQLVQTEAESDDEKKLLSIWKNTFIGNEPNEILEKFKYLQTQFNENSTHIRYASQAMCQTKTKKPQKKVIKLAFVLMLRDRVTGEIVPYDTETQSLSHEAIVHLCDHWFDSIGFYDQIASLIHELSHWYLKTEDYAYVHQNAQYQALTAQKHKNNADSYAFFIKQVLLLKPLGYSREIEFNS